MMSDLVIVKVKDGINIKDDMMEYWRKEILRQKETGVIVLPWFLTAVAVPEDTEIQFEERESRKAESDKESRENSEIKNEVKDLSKRVETLEKQIKEDKEEQLKKLQAELDYAKFRCALFNTIYL